MCLTSNLGEAGKAAARDRGGNTHYQRHVSLVLSRGSRAGGLPEVCLAGDDLRRDVRHGYALGERAHGEQVLRVLELWLGATMVELAEARDAEHADAIAPDHSW